jgi:hypothetical protein
MSALVDHEFSFYRLRFSFQAEDRVHFAKMAANTLRGAFGYALGAVAGEREFQAIFAPGAAGPHPSGLADLPRPFVFRSAHLDGATIAPGQPFHFDVNLFETRRPLAEIFVDAFRIMGQRGIGAGCSRMELTAVQHVDLEGRAGNPAGPLLLSLAPCRTSVDAVTVDFLTPTELKSKDLRVRDRIARLTPTGLKGAPALPEPAFPVLFARVRDRIATLRTLYGGGPMDVDFRALGERASAVRITASSVRLVKVTRHSSRTGQRHPIGGFAGWASYAGPLAEFLPWLEAAAFTGVGRQTTWGKGEIRVRAG